MADFDSRKPLCSSSNNFFEHYLRLEKSSVVFKKTAEQMEQYRLKKPGSFYNRTLYRKISVCFYRGWITPFYLIVQFAPLPVVRYVVGCRLPDRPIANDEPSVLHAVCAAHRINNDESFARFRVLLQFEPDVNKLDGFGQTCDAYVRNPRLLSVILALKAPSTASFNTLPRLPLSADQLGRYDHVLLAVTHRFNDRLLSKHSALAGRWFPFPDAVVDDLCDRFYARHCGLAKRFDFHLRLVRRYRLLEDRAGLIRRVRSLLELAFRYPAAVTTFGNFYQTFEIRELAKDMPSDFTERLVDAYPRFVNFDEALWFLFGWMASVRDSNVPSFKELLRRAVVFRSARQNTFLHFRPGGPYLKLILDAGADVNALNADNYTPLALYANQNWWDCVAELSERGAHLDVKGVNVKKMRKILGVAGAFPLKCLAAKIVKECYPNAVIPSRQLKNFVDAH